MPAKKAKNRNEAAEAASSTAGDTPEEIETDKKKVQEVRNENDSKITTASEEERRGAAESKPAVSKPAVSKPAESKPAESKPAESKPAESKPAESKPSESKPAESKPAESKPAESKPAESKPAESKPAESKPAESKPEERKPVGKPSSAAEMKSAEGKPALDKKPEVGAKAETKKELVESELEKKGTDLKAKKTLTPEPEKEGKKESGLSEDLKAKNELKVSENENSASISPKQPASVSATTHLKKDVIAGGNMETIRALKRYWNVPISDIDDNSNENKYTLLQMALLLNKKKVVEYLIGQKELDLNTKGIDGTTALMTALDKQVPSDWIVAMLERGATNTINDKDNNGKAALDRTEEGTNLYALLIKYGATPPPPPPPPPPTPTLPVAPKAPKKETKKEIIVPADDPLNVLEEHPGFWASMCSCGRRSGKKTDMIETIEDPPILLAPA